MNRLQAFVLSCGLALPTIAFASDKPHPIEGTVTTLGTNPEITALNVTRLHRTYTVKTPTRIFVLQCPYWMDGLHIHSPSECGGKKKFDIGDAIRFRVEKSYAYVLTDKAKEQKLSVLSEGVNDAGVPATATHP
jgi:hypothetical protein